MQDLVYKCEIVVIIFDSTIAKLCSSPLPALVHSGTGAQPHLFVHSLCPLRNMSVFKRNLMSCKVHSVLVYCILFLKISLLASVFQIVERLQLVQLLYLFVKQLDQLQLLRVPSQACVRFYSSLHELCLQAICILRLVIVREREFTFCLVSSDLFTYVLVCSLDFPILFASLFDSLPFLT